VYPELIKSPISDGKKYYLKKRPGVSTFYGPFPNAEGRGIFYWRANNATYTVVGNQLYIDGSLLATLGTSVGPVGFAEYNNSTTDELILCDGTNGYIITSGNSVSQITGSGFPSPHIPNPIFLDGYLFLATPGTQTLYNSALNDPTTWPSDGFIEAEMFPDPIVGLAKVQNYIACIGTGSIEWLYDNANATGSPLERNAPAVSQFGCPAPMTISQTEMELIMVGETGNGGRTIWVINGFQPTEIANEPVREALDLEGSNMSNATGFTIQCAGHKWYVLNLKGNQRTFVYDFEEQMWHEWSNGTGQNCFGFDYATDSLNGNPVLLGQNSIAAQLYSYAMSPSTYTDGGNTINCMVVTSKIDFDTIKRKRLYRLTLIADGPDGNTAVPITVSWSDDDYNTFSTGKTLYLGGGYSTITQLGYTRRRAFEFVYQQPYPLRMEAFEVDIIQEVRR